MKAPIVFGLGQCCLDHVGIADRYPPPDAKCELSAIHSGGGGPVATALVALARWGCRCAFAGVTGDDDIAATIRASLEAEGIDTGGLLSRAGECSQLAFIVAEPRTGRRTIFWRRPSGAPPRPEEIDLDALRRADLVYTDALFPDASLAACRAAREAGVPVLVDAGSLRERTLEVAACSDYFVVSETFSKSLTGEEGPEATCRQLAALGPRVVGVTLGPRGYVALEGGRWTRGEAVRVETVDTTGCGDVFHAGLAYGVLAGWDVERSLAFGAWAAAEVSRRPGGRAGIPRVADWGEAPG
jgi:ribokinase